MLHNLTIISVVLTTMLSQAALAEGLLQVYRQAEQYDAQLKASFANYEAVKESRNQILAGKKIQANFSAGSSINQRYQINDSTDNTSLNGNYNLGVSKSLLNRTLDNQLKQTDAQIAQAKANWLAARQNLINRVIDPYFNYLLSRDALDFSMREAQLVKDQHRRVKAFFDAGKSTITDLQEAQANAQLAQANTVSTQQNVLVSQETLRVLTGRVYNKINGPNEHFKAPALAPPNAEHWIKLAQRNNANLRQMKMAVEVARQGIEVQRSKRGLKLDLFAQQTGSFGMNRSSPIDPTALDASIGINLNLPLYQGGSVQSGIRQAQHQFRQAQQNYVYQQRLIDQQIRTLVLNIEANRNLLQAQQRALSSAQTATAATKTGFDIGTRTNTDVLASISNEYRARRDLASAKYNYLKALIQLKSLAGVMDTRSLQQIDRLMPKPR